MTNVAKTSAAMRGRVCELGSRKLADNMPSEAMPALDAARRSANALL